MTQDPSAQLQIEGHACDLGTGEYNLALSERRADAVREYLAGHGIGAARITTVAYGEERPQNDNSTEALRAENRRAVLNVTAPVQ
jgi:peptidoglycan-associated lipoprotein